MNKTKKLINQYKTTLFSFIILIPFEFRHVGFRSNGSLLVNLSVCPIHRLSFSVFYLALIISLSVFSVWFGWSFAFPPWMSSSSHLCVDPLRCRTLKIMSSIRWRSPGKEALSAIRIGRLENNGRSQPESTVRCADGQMKWMLLFPAGGSEYGANTYTRSHTVLRFYEMQNWINSNAAQSSGMYLRDR